MIRTLGYHLVKSTYGQWLPGDDRGHWSDAWDEKIGFVQPHMLHEGDPVRKRMAEERMQRPAVRMSDAMKAAVADTISQCVTKSAGGLLIAAATIEATHFHLLIPYGGRDIHKTAKWIADQTTKAVHRGTEYQGPVWCKGKWCTFVFDEAHWNNLIEYIERHNVRRGLGRRPFSFVT